MPAIEDSPVFSHYCTECGRPVARSRVPKEDRPGLLCYGSKTLCARDQKLRFRSAPKPKGEVKVDPVRYSNNVAGLQHYIKQRRERLARKCQLSK